MSYQYQCVPEDIKPPLNMGSYSDPGYSGILADIKKEIGEHGSPIASIKVEHDISTNDTKSFQLGVINFEDNYELSESEFKYNKEEQYMTCKEGTSSSRNMENNPVGDYIAGPSSSYELTSKVDLGVMKMEEEDNVTNESSEGEGKERHIRTHGEKFERTFDCLKCEKQFWTKLGLDNHIVSRHSNNDEMLNSVTYKIYRCKYCSYITIQANSFTQHMWTHGKEFKETFDCTTCEKEFSKKRDLDGHIVATHSDNVEMMNSVTCRIYRCKHCSYITVHTNSLNAHMRTHREKVFDCMECEKKFSSKQSLDGHIVTRHSSNAKIMMTLTSTIHRCRHCRYKTVSISDLRKHLMTHGEKSEKTFDCIKCEKEFSTKQNLDGHILARHSNNGEMMNSVTSKIYRCKHCKYMTLRKNCFSKHMRTHEEKVQEEIL